MKCTLAMALLLLVENLSTAAPDPRPRPRRVVVMRPFIPVTPGPRSWIHRRGARPTRSPALTPRRRVGWGPEENMTFIVKLAGVEAARAAISVGRSTRSRGRELLTMRGLAETVTFISNFVRLREEVVTRVDLAGLSPLHSTMDRRTGKPDTDRWMKTHFGVPVVQSVRRKGRLRAQRRHIESPLFDPITSLFVVRSMDLPAKGKLQILVLNGNSLYEVTVSVTGRERIYTKLGPRNAIRLDGRAQRVQDDGRTPVPGKKTRGVSLWLSDDLARVPLKLRGETDLGSIEVSITSYQAPRSPLVVQVARPNTSAAQSPFGARR